MKIFLFLLYLCVFSYSANAQIREYDDLYKIDLQEDIPLVRELAKEYQDSRNQYNWRYDYNWRIPNTFNSKFLTSIRNFSGSEKRISSADEDSIYRDLQRLPKSFYPYIGPMLHNIKGLSGKILDLPGIKETKNKFPEQIASQFKDIPNIEFLSPELYIYLNPVFWGEGFASLEYPDNYEYPDSSTPNIRISPDFIAKIKQKVSVDDYALGQKLHIPETDFRNYNADINTNLSGADVKSFILTLDGLKKFKYTKNYEIRLMSIGRIINYWDVKNGQDPAVVFFKEMVNPCQAIVRRVKWSGLRSEFQKAIGVGAFGLDDWAYTCDKIIKAYRVINMPTAHITAIRLMRKGYYYKVFENMDITAEEFEQQRYFIEALIRMYDSNLKDVEKIRNFKQELHNKIPALGIEYVGTPIIL